MKILKVGAELFRADGRTDGRTKLIVAFRNFAYVPKKCFIILMLVITRILKISLEAKLRDNNRYHFGTLF